MNKYTDNDFLDAIANQSLYGFVMRAYNVLHTDHEDPFIPNWPVEAMCHALQKVERGETKRLPGQPHLVVQRLVGDNRVEQPLDLRRDGFHARHVRPRRIAQGRVFPNSHSLLNRDGVQRGGQIVPADDMMAQYQKG